MAYWLLKSEPDVFSWHDLVTRGASGEIWDGVRNYQARNFLLDMALGDLSFFYHSQSDKAVVGLCEVIGTARPDPTSDDPRWQAVVVRARDALPRPVTLAQVKDMPDLAEMALLRQSRLSVQPVRPGEWDMICRMGGL